MLFSPLPRFRRSNQRHYVYTTTTTMKFSLLAIAALSTTTAAVPRKRKVAKKGEGSANESSGTCDPKCGGTKKEGEKCYGGADGQNREGLCVDGLYCYNYPTTIVSDTSGGAFCCPEGLAPTNQNSCGHLPPPGPGPTPSPVPAPGPPGPPSPFKPATWTINAWATGTDNAAGLCLGICKATNPPIQNYEECKKGAAAGTNAGAKLPFDGCSVNKDGGTNPSPNVNTTTFPKNGTWSFETEYPTFLDGGYNELTYPFEGHVCTSGPNNPNLYVKNGMARQTKWINDFHTQIADNITAAFYQFACIADPNNPTQKLKAMIANGHGPGKCGTVTVWATSANPSTDKDRVVVSIQTGTRNWSTELSAQQYFGEVDGIDGGGGGWFQPYRLDTSDITWDCTETKCDTFPSTNEVEWTRLPASGRCENQSN